MNNLVYAIPCDLERETLHDAILGSLDNLGGAIAYFQVDKTLYRVADCLRVSNYILDSASNVAISPSDNSLAFSFFIGGNGHSFAGRFGRCNDKLVAIYGKVDAAFTGRKGEITQHIVFVCKDSFILAAVPFKFKGLCVA